MARRVAVAALILILGTASTWGCGDDFSRTVLVSDSGSDRDGEEPMDVGAIPADAGPVPAGESILAGLSAGGGEGAEDPDFVGGSDPRSCWDGVDNDDDFERDCDDVGCAAVAACGLGSGTRCQSERDVAITLAPCGTGPATPACLGIAGRAFGSPTPWVAGDRLHPGGGDFDSGIVFDDPLDPTTRRITLTGTFALPSCPSGVLCVESASFGVTGTTRFDAATRVLPTAALQLSGARREVALVIGGTIVERWPFEATSPLWSLDLRPTGEIVVANAGAPRGRAAYAPSASAAVVVYGRNANRAGMEPEGAGLEAFSFESQLCNIPDAWQSRDALALTAGGAAYLPDAPRGPSVHRGGDGVLYLAFEAPGADSQGHIALAAESGVSFDLAHMSREHILAPADVESGLVRVGDPELYWDEAESTWHLFFTGETPEQRRIGLASGPTLTTLSFSGWVVEPLGNITVTEMPTVARSADGRWILAARVEKTDGHALAVFVGAAAAGPYVRHAGVLEVGTFRDGSGARFDADEIASPSLRVVDGAYHLYFAGRRGTRWAVGVWTSAELVFWRDVTRRDPLLSGTGAGFDALGVRDPDVLVEGTLTRLFYVGDDGAAQQLGVVSRPRPDGF